MDQEQPAGPVAAHSEIAVAASVRRVWSVLAGIDEWPTWNPAVREAALDGALETGTPFRWAAGPGTIASRLTTVDSPWTLAWQGTSMGVRQVQVWRLDEQERGCLVRTDGTLSGPVARLFARRLRRRLQGDLDTWVRLLKLESEARDAEGEAPSEPAP